MNQLYSPCPCDSGKKFKFCCAKLIKIGSLPENIEELCTKFPVAHCYTIEEWKEIGKAPILIARLLPTGNYMLGMYLIDLFCLGVKDAFIRMNITPSELEAFKERMRDCCQKNGPLEKITYEKARSIVFGSLAFAAKFGFAPHADWELAKLMIEPNRTFIRDVTFGQNKKPLYIPGPYDENIDEIIDKVETAGGDFMIDL